ncbi:hypothetical protein AB8B21_18240 [Tardiphaga sp. 866_E4_N2_1]|uniref:hypothetical protein n=1 Tax=unclassified Tardiphaga TaxID=2631404 RepID=UPI003F1F6B07
MPKIEWDGTALSGKADVGGRLVDVVVDRGTIHQHAAGFSDALSWEIDRFREEIFDKLQSFFALKYTEARLVIEPRRSTVPEDVPIVARVRHIDVR